MSDIIEIKELLQRHIKESNDYRERSERRMDLMQKSLDRYNQIEIGLNAVMKVGRFIIYTAGICGTVYMFFHDYFKK